MTETGSGADVRAAIRTALGLGPAVAAGTTDAPGPSELTTPAAAPVEPQPAPPPDAVPEPHR